MALSHWWSSFFFLGDAFPAGSSPFLSGYPGPSPLTSDPAYRSASASSLQMAQLWASHAHDGKSLFTSASSCISFSFSVSVHISNPYRHIQHYIIICHLSNAQETCSSPHCFHKWHRVPFLSLLVAVLLALSYMHLIFSELHPSSTLSCHELV